MILFVSTYYNNSHFIKYQYLSFKKYIKEPFDFVILNDARRSTTNVISGRKSDVEIENECKKYGIKHVKIPQNIHTKTRNTAGSRHQANLNWYFSSNYHDKKGYQYAFNHKIYDNPNRFSKKDYDKYDYIIIMDADVCINKPIELEKLTNNNEFSFVGPSTGTGGYIYIYLIFMLINLKNIPYEKIREFNFSEIKGAANINTDTAGGMYNFFTKYPEYKVKYTTRTEFLENFQSGSNWNNKSKEDYVKKFESFIDKLKLSPV